MFTRFLEGYNEGHSQLMKIDISSLQETIIIPSNNSGNVNVPGPSWINNKICWASDRAGLSDEIYIADDSGENIIQITIHKEEIGYYVEPVFNPIDINKIIFEYGPSDIEAHRISIVEIDNSNKVTYLTNGTFNDCLPNWSFDGNKILFQRADKGKENWQIFTASVTYNSSIPVLQNITKIIQPDSHNTDNSWFINNKYILSSSDYNIDIPNIYAFPIDGSNPVRITYSYANEDGAPSCSHDGKWIIFESHIGQDEDTPSDIWIIETPTTLME